MDGLKAKHQTDMARARKFAIEWATKDSSGEIANLARAFLRVSKAQELMDRMARAADGASWPGSTYEPMVAMRHILGWPEGSERLLQAMEAKK